jgi:putative membrane protein
MRLGHWVSLVVLASSLVAATACSDDEDTTTGTTGGSGGSGGSGGAGRAGGGQGGASGSSGRGPDGGGGTGGSGGAAGAAGTTGGQGGTAGGRGGAAGSTPDASDAPDVLRLSDGQVVGVAHAANLGEIQEAMLAETRAMNADVRAFAMMMNTEHSAADRDLLNLAADAGPALMPSDSAVSLQLTATAMMKLQALQPLMGMAFDRAYMTDQVEMHTQVLTLINDLLLPSAMNMALRTQLSMMRTAVTMHLAQARTILQTISSDAGDAGDGGADADAADAADGDAADGAADGAADSSMDGSDGRMGDASDGG